MKLYEKMRIDLNTAEGLRTAMGLVCENFEGHEERRKHCSGWCSDCIANQLFAEVPTKKVPRIATINTVDELKQTLIDLNEFCDTQENCRECVYGSGTISCFDMWLAEEIEVEE